MKRFLHCFFCAMLLMCTSIGPAVAQGYPNRPIHMIVPYPTAGGVDKAGRLMAELLSAKLGQPIVVDNKPGAASALGIEIAAKAVPDGYTILMTNSDGITMLPNLKKNIPYAVPKDFTFIARMLLVPLTVSISTKMPFNSMADLIAYAKANPGKLRYGTPGVGSGPHLATLLLEKAGGIKLDHIPYRGSAASMNDLLGGHIEVSLNAVQAVAPLAAGGKIKMLAVTGPTRDAFAPELPTLAELGMPGATVAIWYGILGPANMPPAIVDRLRKDMMAVLTSPEAKQKFMAAGFQPDPAGGRRLREVRDGRVQDVELARGRREDHHRGLSAMPGGRRTWSRRFSNVAPEEQHNDESLRRRCQGTGRGTMHRAFRRDGRWQHAALGCAGARGQDSSQLGAQ